MVGLHSSSEICEQINCSLCILITSQNQEAQNTTSTPKKDHAITTYLLDIKKIVDILAVICSPISNNDNAETIVTLLLSRVDP